MMPVPAVSSRSLVELDLLTVASALDGEALVRGGMSPDDAGAVVKCATWTTTYPLQRVRKRRRVEAICPMVAPSLAAGAMRFAAFPLPDPEPPLELLDSILRAAATAFEERVRCDDPRLRCLVLVLPGVRGARLLEATDPGREIKNELLRRGILAGEFFPACPFATTFNPRLFALRSPAPMYVLRTFLETDWRFICQIPAWQATYRERFGEPPPKLRHLGGPVWRLKQKFLWRLDALRSRLFPPCDPAGTDGTAEP